MVGLVITFLTSSLRRASFLAALGLFTGLAPTVVLRADPPAAEVQVQANLTYKSGDTLSDYEKERCQLDLYLPAGKKDFATLVWFHGGGLTGGTKDDASVADLARSLARSGLAVAAANYRLSPKAKFPAYIEDAAAAFAWVHGNIDAHGGDPQRVFVGGHSAGAYLTLMVGLDSRYLKRHGLETSSIAGLVPLSGQTLTHYTIREERGLPKETLIADEAAPIHYARKDAPPMLVLFAEHDMPMRVEENRLLVAALKAAGNTGVTGRLIADRDHGSIADNIAKPDDPVRAVVVEFVSRPARP